MASKLQPTLSGRFRALVSGSLVLWFLVSGILSSHSVLGLSAAAAQSNDLPGVLVAKSPDYGKFFCAHQ